MEKSSKKRPAKGEDEERKHSKPRPNDKEVEEFFALIRRIRSTAKLLGKGNGRSQSVRWDDFDVVSFHNSVPEPDGPVSEKGKGSERSSRDGSPTLPKEEKDEKEEGKRERIRDNGSTGWFDLNVEAPVDVKNLW